MAVRRMSGDIAGRFQRDTATHRMTVLHDDGLYRHLRFRSHHLCNDAEYRPTSSFYWFDLITWPGSLAINGDCGSFVFSRITDMFEFFRSRYGINPQYWAEKLRAPEPAGATEYSEDRFRQLVVEYVTEAIRYRCAPRGIGRAIRDEIFGDFAKWDIQCEDGARLTLRDFEYGTTYTAECICGMNAEGLDEEDASLWRIRHTGGAHKATVTRIEGFTFQDAWEWDLRDYGWQYLWCCHAIQWGIAQYDSQRVTP